MQRILSQGIHAFIVFFFLFALHRFFAFPYLAGAMDPGALRAQGQALLVGLASDWWVAGLASLLLVLGLGMFRLLRRRVPGQLLTAGAGGLMLLAVVGHQSYVEFFRLPLIPFHLEYLADPFFLQANYTSLFSWRNFMLASFGMAAVVVLPRSRALQFPRPKRAGILLALVYTAALALHAWNIRYRVHWYVPEPLQMNLFEFLHSQLLRQRVPLTPQPAELTWLQQRLQIAHAADPQTKFKQALEQVVLTEPVPQPAEQAGAVETALALRATWQRMVADGAKPLAVVVLMESLRAIDVGAYGGSRKSLTPHFDQLARRGILFKNAWATGTVTRGGQEAVWCGYLGSMATSLMRTHTQIKLACLPDLVKDGSFWYHGGEGRFDNQAYFWQKHGVKNILTSADFAPGAARTGWGVGDRSFLQEAFHRIADNDRHAKVPYQFGMLLTVSNHIPWDVPADAPPAMAEAPSRGVHPSEQTVFYSDLALGEFVTSLAVSGLWQKTLMIVVGDHGIHAPPLQDDGDAVVPANVQRSKIAMALTGGMLEGVLAKRRADKQIHTRNEWVSQADVAPFLDFVLGLEGGRYMGEPLLLGPRRRPIVADLGEVVYFPQLQREVGVQHLLADDLTQIDDPELRLAMLYYRSVLKQINLWSVGGTSS